MKKVKIVVMLMMMTCLIFPQSSFAKDTKKVGNVLSTSGDVEMKKGGGKKAFKVFKNMAFTQGDTVITGSNGKAELSLDKDKEVSVGSNTKLVISELISSVKAKSGKTELTLVGGKVKVKVNKKLEGESRFKIQTPNAIMGVMGTEFYVYYDENGTWVGVLEGEVTVDNGGTHPIKVGANQSLLIDDDGNHQVIKLDAEQVLRFKLEGSNESQGKPIKPVIVYDPVVTTPEDFVDNVPDSPNEGTGGGQPPVQNPTFVSADKYNPDPELRDQLTIRYASNGDIFTKLFVVIDENTIEEVEEIHFDRLDNGVLLKKEFLQNMIQSDQTSTEMRLKFASGFILPVTLERMPLVEVDEDVFKEKFFENYQDNNIVIPFTKSIEFNSGDGQAPSSLEEGVFLEGGTGDQSVINNVTIDKNRLVINLNVPLPTSTGESYAVVIINHTLRTQENGVVQRELIAIQLPEVD